ncbi:MAG TPA: type II toxin-antitoxin system VapC family toxin, partial [Anaerolineales bacterium]|nr:type II toxin-antitoxin system VapC family toxin [Anaerolineales bacterium]
MSYWVVDANIAIQTALIITANLEKFWERVDQEQITPCAPRLWLSEVTSAIRFLVSRREITSEEAEDALRTIHGLRVEMINEDEELSLRALELAGKLGQSKAYDAFYLALAEKLVVDFWTMDE